MAISRLALIIGGIAAVLLVKHLTSRSASTGAILVPVTAPDDLQMAMTPPLVVIDDTEDYLDYPITYGGYGGDVFYGGRRIGGRGHGGGHGGGGHRGGSGRRR